MLCVNKKCAAELPDGAVFCHMCGKRQTAEPHKEAKQKSGGTAYKYERVTFMHDGKQYEATGKTSA